MHHNFDVHVAKLHGIGVAVFLSNMAYWITENHSRGDNFRDGNTWTYKSVRGYAELFPYLSTKQVRTIIDKCLKAGLIVKGKYNIKGYDQTSWYAFTQKGAETARLLICPFRQIDLPSGANGVAQKGKPIPNKKTNKKTDKIKSSCPSDKKIAGQKQKAPDSCPKGSFLEPLKINPDRNEPHVFAEKMNRQAETRSIVPFFGPGHPSWEARNEWEQEFAKEKARMT